ncbi:MAG: DUF4097 family beta strand repeat-containing protein [Opitutaceae bacterium]|jgi:hypothetical protein
MKTILALLSALAFTIAAQAKVSETIQQTHPFSPTGSIELSNVNGRVEIAAWDKNEVSIEAVKTAPDDEALKRIEVRIDAGPSSLSIITHHEKKWYGSSRGEVSYKLRVPSGVALKAIETVNSDVTIASVRGKVCAGTVNGSIHASDVSSNVTLHTVNGSIEAQVDKLIVASHIELKTVNGSCEIAIPADSSTRVDASTVNGHVRCDLPIVISRSNRNTLHGTIGSGAGTLVLSSVNGGLSITKI